MPLRIGRGCFVLAAIIGAAGALSLAWLPTATALSHFVIEDFGYYLTAARHVMAGHGATLDGVNPTNGFHPLWLIMICGVELLAGSSGPLAFHLSLTLAAACFIATGCVLCWAVRADGAAWLVAPFAAIFFFNYRLMSVPLGGLETGVAGLSIVIVAVAVSRWEGAMTGPRAACLGTLLGLACLARMDAFLFDGIVVAWLAYRAWRVDRFRQLSLLAIGAGTAALVLLPWFVFSWRSVHHLLPRSGDAILLWSPSPWHRPWTLPGLSRAARATLVGPAGDIANAIGVWPLVNGARMTRGTGAIALALTIGALAVAAWRVRDDERVKRVAWIPIVAACQWGYYLQFNSEHIRYLYPPILLLFYFTAVVIGAGCRRTGNERAWIDGANAAAAAMLVCLCASGVSAYRQGFASGYTHRMHGAIYEDVVPWLRTQTPPTAIVGAFNAGLISYFSGRTTIDLDGVMNDRSLEAIKASRLCDFIQDQHITYLADSRLAIDYFMQRDASCGASAWRTHWKEVRRIAWPPNGGRDRLDWIILARVTPGGHPQ